MNTNLLHKFTTIPGTETHQSAAPRTNPILLVEDSADDVFLFLDLLKKSRIVNPVTVVCDGDEAIEYLNREGRFADPKNHPLPSAVFLDLKMPKTGGLDVLRWINAQPHLSDLLCVVLTHHQELETTHQAYQLGAHSFLTKPLTHSDLSNLMLHFENHFHGCAPLTTPANSPQSV